MKIHTQAKKIYEQVINKISEHKTLEKKSANLLKQAQTINLEMEEKDIEKENVENEIARVGIDGLNTTNQLEVLKQKKREVSEERKKKEEMVATYELEIRQGHDINEKKQSEVGKLNKQHDEIINNSSEISRGPQEAHRNHLWNQMKEKAEESMRLEREWIKKQTTLVKQQQQLNRVSEESSTLTTKKTILEQKKMRLYTNHQNHEKEIRNIKISLKNLQTEMNKLNDGLSRNQGSETKLKNENFHIQSEFVEKLKELEHGNVKLELDIDDLKEAKASLLQNIVEAERQLLLWERKIQLEREIQDALDPNIGQSEIKLLQKDIHRMELRLDELRKRQEQTIQEMERSVYKRETIQLKYIKNDDVSDKKGGKENKNQVTRQIENLRGTLAQTSKNNKEYERKLNQLQVQINDKNNMMSGSESATMMIEGEVSDKLAELNQKRVERLRGVFEVVRLQTLYKSYDNIAINKFRPEGTENQVKQRLGKQRGLNLDMFEVLNEVANVHPQFADIIQQLTEIQAE
jgi:chromosome segregation ATPase